ncbi:pyruvate, phosphate dikinase/phosphoenolpyruvate synthase regulator [Candidatus Deianiraea vastatrix]|uniref:Pyruvate, phosphate dikinase regulatory protein n=1 Tax=Candidatus Deianiraea vastatrix TaxID=2163644 RepID=A0A5B8XD64_9RICK|nr:pyruvate, phosphate dikinase/phosphoenolpyruvate synthase regulator [Candidatus Deianiraea vastatrix]QED23272.1 Putative pyruvate, phosphate dikinase regulatory protein [Candidatus Deianiraea vastatrix]
MKEVNIHLISDFTCDMLMNISSVLGSQFPNVKINRFFHQFIRSIDQADDIILSLKANPGIILFSVLSDEIEEVISKASSEIQNCKIIPLMDYMLSEMSSHIGIKSEKISRSAAISQDYFARMNAMSFTINHDDGRLAEESDEADIVLIGVSRTSKSPTSIYLAHKGYKVANIPFVAENLMPKNLLLAKNPLIIGLNIDHERLIWLRESRMQTDGTFGMSMQYNDTESVIDELREFRRYCGKLGCVTIDVTKKSIEEVAAYIIKIYQTHKE